VTESLRADAPLLDLSEEPGREVLRMPVGPTWFAAPTAAMLYQFSECAYGGTARGSRATTSRCSRGARRAGRRLDRMQRPLLYTFRRCPYAMRARMALLQAGIGFDAHEIVLRDKPAEMLSMSPKGTVPVLVLPGGQAIDESLDIMQWAFEGGAAVSWWQRAQSDSCQRLIALNDGPFKQYLDGYKYPERHPSDKGPDFHRDQALMCLLHLLDRQLAGQPFLGGDEPCAADLAIFPFVRQFRAVDERWFDAQALHATQRWLQGWLESEIFQRCMKKLKVGSALEF